MVEPMPKPTNDHIRKLFTDIGCIMEDASPVALTWRADDGLHLMARYQKILDAHAKIDDLLSQIDSATSF